MVHRRSSLPGLALTALLTIPAGCATDTEGDPACPTPTTAPPAELALLPAGLSFDQIGPITHVLSTAGHITVRAVTTKHIDEVTILIQDAITAAGYRPAGMDNEGFEAEVFFTSGPYAAGQALVRRSTCQDRWDIELVLIDPSTVPSPTALPTTT